MHDINPSQPGTFSAISSLRIISISAIIVKNEHINAKKKIIVGNMIFSLGNI